MVCDAVPAGKASLYRVTVYRLVGLRQGQRRQSSSPLLKPRPELAHRCDAKRHGRRGGAAARRQLQSRCSLWPVMPFQLASIALLTLAYRIVGLRQGQQRQTSSPLLNPRPEPADRCDVVGRHGAPRGPVLPTGRSEIVRACGRGRTSGSRPRSGSLRPNLRSCARLQIFRGRDVHHEALAWPRGVERPPPQ